MPNIIRFCAVFLGLAVLLVAQNPNRAAYIIRSGDTLQVAVAGERDLTQTVVVDGEGAVTLPLIGRAKAEGLNVSQFTQRIKDALARYVVNPEVVTSVQNIGRAVPD